APNTGLDVAVVDIGSSTVKLYLKKGSTGEVVSESFRITLGESLGQSGEIDESAFESLKESLEKVALELRRHQFSIRNVEIRATAGLRDAGNSATVLKRLKAAGYPVKILSEEAEAKLVYRTVLRGQPISAVGAAVIEVGGGSTEIVFGKSLMEIDAERTAVIRAGSGSLAIADPFNEFEIKKASEKVRGLLLGKSQKALETEHTPAFLNPGAIMKTFRNLHFSLSGEDVYLGGISDEMLNHYLSDEGLSQIKKAALTAVTAAEAEKISAIPSKLLVLREVKHHYQFRTLRFGTAGGMKEALAFEAEACMVGKHIDRTTQKMVKHWLKSETEIIDKMTQLFEPEVFGKWDFRVKQVQSLESKLTSKWISGLAKLENFKKTRFAHETIGDGVGGRLTLDRAAPEDMDLFFARLLTAVRTKEIRITEIHNYRAAGVSPYLSETQIQTLSQTIEKSSGRKPIVRNGAETEKASGYTAIHFNLVDSKGVPLEIQVRGKKVSDLAEFEHDLYDIRQGKAANTVDPKLVKVVQNLNSNEQNALLNYIRDCYAYVRRIEQNKIARPPLLPSALSAFPELSMETKLNSALPR
ncbi:MAG: hypothetical protein H7333_08555, partial [Bdellovibrionales bacterium]|nr:hypothetical protein [Oligoflexia bacterium]